ncbi:hypothetical protein L1887_30441 [Cichorium endivia]|nr:hypothetical protein L1887_30441 [Cichorium endivia]
MHHPAIISGSKLSNWVSKIKESSFNGRWQEVLSSYNDMNKAGVQLTEPSLFHPILKACSAISFTHGKSLHATVIKLGVESSTSIANSIMDFYTKAGRMNSTVTLFGSMNIRDSISWNILISGHIDQGDYDRGMHSFMQARATGFEPNISTLVLVIQTCRNLGALHEGQKIHGYMIKTEFLAISSLQNSLLLMYAEMAIEYAQKLFDEMPNRDVIAWSVMISAYVKTNKTHLALEIFKEMLSQSETEIDGQTIVSALKACTDLKNLITGRTLHGFIFHKGFFHDSFLGNSLIDMYSKCNDPNSALQTWTEMPLKNIISWNSIISGLVYSEKYSEAIHLFNLMQNDKVAPDAVTLVNLLQICKHFTDPFICKSIHAVILRRNHESNDLVVNTLIDTYAKCNLIFIAQKLFNWIKIRDVVSWSTMIAAFTYCGLPNEAIRVFNEMMESQEKPNAITLLNLIEASSYDSDLKIPKSVHGIAIRTGFSSDAIVGTAILDVYARYGDIMTSKKVFDSILNKNIVSYSAMIGAYGMNGVPRSAISLLNEMETSGLKPNSITILSLLSACSHGGLVHEGLSLFRKLTETLEVKPSVQHYSCLVDLLSRSGNLDLAMKLAEGYEGGASAWGALLSGLRMNYNENEDILNKVVNCVLELEPNNSNGYMLASNMYVKKGNWEDVARIRGLVRDKNVKIVAGFSMVNVNNKSRKFVAGDRNQFLSNEMRDTIENLHELMKMDH